MSVPLHGFDSNTRPYIGRLCRRLDCFCLSSQLAFRAGRRQPGLDLRCHGQYQNLSSTVADGLFSSPLRIYQVLVSTFSLAPLSACEDRALRIKQPPWFSRPLRARSQNGDGRA